MFHNIIRQCLAKRCFGARTQFSRNLSGAAKAGEEPQDGPEEYQRRADAELEESLRIERMMFENSTVQHKPVEVKTALRKNAWRTNAPARAKSQTSIFTEPAQQRKPETQVLSKLIEDRELGLQFVRVHNKDSVLSTLMTTIRSRKRRNKNDQIVVEGRRLIREALECGLRLQTLIFSDMEKLKELGAEVAAAQRQTQCKIYKTAMHELKTWSTLSTPPGLLAIFERPPHEGIATKQCATAPIPVTVVCDNIREPNNLGSIVRTCAAVPVQQVIVTRGCCDPWESKALRGGCGGHFRVPILDDVDWANLPLLIPPEEKHNCCVFIAENNTSKLQDQTDMSVNYTDLRQIGKHNIVIIGGESHGVSESAYNFLKTVGNRGQCLHIPVAEGIDSLNVVSAATLILYELRKRLLEREE